MKGRGRGGEGEGGGRGGRGGGEGRREGGKVRREDITTFGKVLWIIRVNASPKI